MTLSFIVVQHDLTRDLYMGATTITSSIYIGIVLKATAVGGGNRSHHN